MFEVGDLIKRKATLPRPKGICVVVDRSEDNYTVYNTSLKCSRVIAIPVINGLYNKVSM